MVKVKDIIKMNSPCESETLFNSIAYLNSSVMFVLFGLFRDPCGKVAV